MKTLENVCVIVMLVFTCEFLLGALMTFRSRSKFYLVDNQRKKLMLHFLFYFRRMVVRKRIFLFYFHVRRLLLCFFLWGRFIALLQSILSTVAKQRKGRKKTNSSSHSHL